MSQAKGTVVTNQLEIVYTGTAVIHFELLSRYLSGSPEKNKGKCLLRIVIKKSKSEPHASYIRSKKATQLTATFCRSVLRRS
jgi:hypothetical protein